MTTVSVLMRVGPVIRALRLEREWLQGRLAKEAGLDVSHIRMIEQGRRPNITLVTLEKLAFALDVPATFIIFLAESEGEHQGLYEELTPMLQVAVGLLEEE